MKKDTELNNIKSEISELHTSTEIALDNLESELKKYKLNNPIDIYTVQEFRPLKSDIRQII